jgi:hypothetical protein
MGLGAARQQGRSSATFADAVDLAIDLCILFFDFDIA